MGAGHFIYIPATLFLGMVIGWILGSRAARDAFAAELTSAARSGSQETRGPAERDATAPDPRSEQACRPAQPRAHRPTSSRCASAFGQAGRQDAVVRPFDRVGHARADVTSRVVVSSSA